MIVVFQPHRYTRTQKLYEEFLGAFSDADLVADQLGRMPRGVAGIAWRCPCGKPGVVATEPRLPDGTPFPTTYYLTCPRAVAAVSTLEAEGSLKS